jgi:hypothetical protein
MAEDQTLFASVIEQHLALKRRNAELVGAPLHSGNQLRKLLH